MVRHTTDDVYGTDEREPWTVAERRSAGENETVIVDGAAMSFRSYRRRGGRG